MRDKVRLTLEVDGKTREYLVSRADAKEIEISIHTGIPKRLMRSVIKVGKRVSGKRRIKKSRVVGESRSGHIYSAIKYMKEKRVITEEHGKIIVCDAAKLSAMVKNLETLLKGNGN
ncbi:MAG: hypothetical protein ACFE7E_06270 [Candidatus Hodarchaeota archaeon]